MVFNIIVYVETFGSYLEHLLLPKDVKVVSFGLWKNTSMQKTVVCVFFLGATWLYLQTTAMTNHPDNTTHVYVFPRGIFVHKFGV